MKKSYAKIKKDLLVEKEKAIESIKIHEATTLEPEQALTEDGDISQQLINKNMTITLLEGAQKKLRQINLILEKLSDEEYGVCEDCGEEIEIKRLMANPLATLCIIHQEAKEREEKINKMRMTKRSNGFSR